MIPSYWLHLHTNQESINATGHISLASDVVLSMSNSCTFSLQKPLGVINGVYNYSTLLIDKTKDLWKHNVVRLPDSECVSLLPKSARLSTISRHDTGRIEISFTILFSLIVSQTLFLLTPGLM